MKLVIRRGHNGNILNERDYVEFMPRKDEFIKVDHFQYVVQDVIYDLDNDQILVEVDYK